ncbi:MAG: transcriptional regulator [Streptosporangiaceae bacterium]
MAATRRQREVLEREWARHVPLLRGADRQPAAGPPAAGQSPADQSPADQSPAGRSAAGKSAAGRYPAGRARREPGRVGSGPGAGRRQSAGWAEDGQLAGVRPEVAESWQRSLRSVEPDAAAAPASGAGMVASRWADSPLRVPVTELADDLDGIADAGYIAAVTDETGTILWTRAGRVMQRRAEKVNFAPGGCWDEAAIGTNALALALHNGRPSVVFSAEHLVAVLHGWVCYCAPIRDPAGRILGVLDLSTTWDRSEPLGLPTARALASAVELRLRDLLGGCAPAASGIELTCLGNPDVRRDGVPLTLSPRQLEILALLALHPHGFSPGGLSLELYGDRPVSATTLKSEVSHLRRAVGGIVSERRYALTAPISCDAADVWHALERGDVTSAVRRYRGALLPDSQAPGVDAWRSRLEVALREAVLASGDPAHAMALSELSPFDVQVHEHAMALLRADDARRGLLAARLHAALRD